MKALLGVAVILAAACSAQATILVDDSPGGGDTTMSVPQQLSRYSTSGMNVTLDDCKGLAATFNEISTVKGTWTLAIDEMPGPPTRALIIFGAIVATLFFMRVAMN